MGYRALFSLLLLPLIATAAEVTGRWSGAYELRKADNGIRYEDLLVILEFRSGALTGSIGPHEYEQYQISNARVNESGVTFEVSRGRFGSTFFSLVFSRSGERLQGKARIEQVSRSETADVVLDRVPATPPKATVDRVDLDVMQRIRAEGMTNSRIMDHAFYLTDVYGPRLTGSHNFKQAGDWAVRRLRELGLQNVTEEPIPNPYPGWQCTRFTVQQLEPVFASLIGAPLAWSTGTAGAVVGDAVSFVPTESDRLDPKQFFERFRGKLKGRFVLIDVPQALRLPSAPLVSRLTDEEIADLTRAPAPAAPVTVPSVANVTPPALSSPIELPTSWLNRPQGFIEDVFRFIQQEAPAALVQEGRRLNEGGTIRAMGVRSGLPPSFVLASEHYNRISRLLDHGMQVRLELDLDAEFHDSSEESFNVIGELPGSRKSDEVVMLGAHLDSWAAGTGATDNAAGCAMVIEAVRILKQLNLTMDRTVRVALWGAEETGPIGGSSAYVKRHFADLETHTRKPEYPKLSVYFNLDSGTGKVRGVYLEGYEGARPSVERWFEPFKDLGVTLIGRRISFGSDQAPFIRAGLPVIYLEQDPLDFETRTNHTNMDVYDRLQSEDLKQGAVVLAALVYNAATRDEQLPRKPLLPFALRQ
ncbi:MAG: M20/M25/M40 family metallo-hydrolase [Acidobacteriia bacterium]|nr:M20/M25/M40 family metallo-hydrolase [Terriglobia bacterium]